LLVAALCPLLLSGQERKQLESKRNNLLQQIEYASKLLKESQKSKATTLEDYRLLQKQVKAREDLLTNLNEELKELDREVYSYEDSISYVQDLLDRQIQVVRQISQEQFIFRESHNEWAFVLSASSFQTAMLRWNLLSQMRRNAARQIEEYKKSKDELERLVAQRLTLRAEQAVLMEDARKNVQLLEKEARQKQQSLSTLEQKEKKLRADLDRKNKERNALNRAIEAQIAAELKAAESGKSELADAPAIAKLSKGFEQNRGKLPWPLTKGVITGHFGKHPHPTLKQVTIVNNGIDIRTEAGAQAKALFDGKVVGIKYIPGYEQMVIIQHGTYYSVYSKLDEVAIQKGQQVKTGQVLGTVWQNQNSGIFELHLEIWNGKKQLDPETWIARR
jgi:murein hydrolase activator